jgi:hypothetical protein
MQNLFGSKNSKDQQVNFISRELLEYSTATYDTYNNKIGSGVFILNWNTQETEPWNQNFKVNTERPAFIQD